MSESGDYGERLCVHVADELARREPDRIYATVTRSSSDIEHGFRDITFRQFANAVNHAAWHIHMLFGPSTDGQFPVIAYIAVSDLRYAIYLYAAIKTGYQLMIPSVRNSAVQHQDVFAAAKCTRVLHTPTFESTIAQVRETTPELQHFTVPELDYLISIPCEHYKYTRTWAEARTDPIIIAHSSGSTGTPKPTTITHGVYSTYDSHRKIPQIPGRKIQGYTLLELDGGKFYNPFPPFHLAGLFAMTIMPTFYNCTVTTGPADKPPTGELLSQAMRKLKIRAAWCPPTVIEQLVEQPGGFEQAASLDWIMYTGGPLAQSVGDKLSQVTDVCQMYGSTETGPHISLVPLPGNQSYFEWHPLLENVMEPMGDGTFEMVVYKDPKLDWIRHLSQAYPHLEVWRTNDLFVQHPTNPKLWRFHGRRDDVLVLSNGEKFNPVYMEGAIVGHPYVRGALIVGTGRFQASLIVEPRPDLDMPANDFIREIWPTVQEANKLGPAHGRIFRSKITVGTPDKPFIRAGKGTVIRGRTTKLYADEVEALYADEALPRAKVPCSVDKLPEITTYVRSCVEPLLSETLADTDDLFVFGMDSLQTLEFTKSLNREFAGHFQQRGLGVLPASTIYTHPTIEQLSLHLYRVLNEKESFHATSALDRTSLMDQLIQKYSANLPRRELASHTPEAREGLCVALTGSTGSLGQELLSKLIPDSRVSRIYCLNRAADARSRHIANLQARALDLSLDDKVTFFTTNFDDSTLGLSASDYESLVRDVDVVIHNAWKVNFNHELGSFEDVHIRGIRNMIDFSVASDRNTHIFFVSSLSSVGNWPAINGVGTDVPEVAMTDSNVAMKLGYGESKHVAERVLQNAVQESGIQCTILRVGQLAGPLSGSGGVWNRTEWFPTLVKTSKAAGKLPDAMNTIDWIPVDEMASILLELVQSGRQSHTSDIFNLANPKAADWQSLASVICDTWGPDSTKVVPFEEWLETMSRKDSESSEEVDKFPAIKMLDFYRGLAQETQIPAQDRIKYEVKRAAGQSNTMANLAPVDGKAMATWLGQWAF